MYFRFQSGSFFIRITQFLKFIIHMQSNSNNTKSEYSSNNFHWIIEPSQLNQQYGLALGNMKFASNANELKKNEIGAVLSVMGEAELKLDGEIKHLRILISDDPQQNIKCFFDSSAKFIANNIKERNVLVHCLAGVSRSATITAAYLMVTNKIGSKEAIQFLKQKRCIVSPNRGFVKQLMLYEQQLSERSKNQSRCCIY